MSQPCIDVIIPIYKNYNLMSQQLEAWAKIKGSYRLMFCDNTPPDIRVPIAPSSAFEFYTYDSEGWDSERHGSVLDFMMSKTKSAIVCIQDSDFFWTNPDILSLVYEQFQRGYQCIGTEFYYDCVKRVFDKYPARANVMVPCIFGMFVSRSLALSTTFVGTKEEATTEWKETGWRLRDKIYRENIPCIVFPAFQVANQATTCIKDSWFYAGFHSIVGYHLLKGSGENLFNTLDMQKVAQSLIA